MTNRTFRTLEVSLCYTCWDAHKADLDVTTTRRNNSRTIACVRCLDVVAEVTVTTAGVTL